MPKTPSWPGFPAANSMRPQENPQLRARAVRAVQRDIGRERSGRSPRNADRNAFLLKLMLQGVDPDTARQALVDSKYKAISAKTIKGYFTGFSRGLTNAYQLAVERDAQRAQRAQLKLPRRNPQEMGNPQETELPRPVYRILQQRIMSSSGPDSKAFRAAVAEAADTPGLSTEPGQWRGIVLNYFDPANCEGPGRASSVAAVARHADLSRRRVDRLLNAAALDITNKVSNTGIKF